MRHQSLLLRKPWDIYHLIRPPGIVCLDFAELLWERTKHEASGYSFKTHMCEERGKAVPRTTVSHHCILRFLLPLLSCGIQAQPSVHCAIWKSARVTEPGPGHPWRHNSMKEMPYVLSVHTCKTILYRARFFCEAPTLYVGSARTKYSFFTKRSPTNSSCIPSNSRKSQS